MKLGILFPTNQIGTDPIAIRDFAQGAEGAGFDFLTTYEHVTGAHPDRFAERAPPGGRAAYLHDSPFHEPFTLYSFIAGLTSRIELCTSVVVLPQRQTALVAKQAAEVDLLSRGRFRLGIGIGWNYTEYETLGQDFHDRGRRVEEQMEVLRLLWSQELASFSGRWHQLDRVAINPLPGRQIPIWIGGGSSEAVLRRIARFADGWIPFFGDDAEETIARLKTYLEQAGRPAEGFPTESGLGNPANQKEAIERATRLQSLGVTHLTINFTGDSRPSPDVLAESIKARELIRSELGA